MYSSTYAAALGCRFVYTGASKMLSKRFSVIGVVCALASGVLFAQDFAIDGKDFESGAADAKLAVIARQAAASGKTIVVTTPPYWQSKVAGKLRAAAPGVQVKTADAFFENVLVRVVDAGKQPAKPDAPAATPAAKPAEAAPAAPVEVATAPAKPASRAPAPAKVATAETETPPPAAPAKVEHAEVALAKPAAAPPPPAAPVQAPASAPQVASIAPPPSATAVKPKAADADVATIKQKFENQLNLGHPAIGAIRPLQLQKGDEIFVNGPVRAAVRKDHSRVQLYWLEGDLNLERAELLKTDANRYRVSEAIRDIANPNLRSMHSEPKMFAAQIPSGKIRVDMERHFNDAKVIGAQMRPEDLRYGDLFYLYRSHGVVFRRNDMGFDRYWLIGDIDLNQSGVIKDGDAYRIVSEKL